MDRRLRVGPALSFFLLAGLAVLVGLLFGETPRPSADATRYIDYAVNLHTHGTFGLSRGAIAEPPQTGNANSPLYPAWLAMIMVLDTGFRDSLLCLVQESKGTGSCPLNFDLLVTAQLLLTGVTLFAVWLLARRLAGNTIVAWLAAGLVLLAKPPLQYAHLLLTEALLLPLLSLFVLALVIAHQDRRPGWLLAAGILLGLATLTRPAYVYLFYAVTVVLVAASLWQRHRAVVLALVLFAAGFAVTVSPWVLRNKHHFDSYALTSGYADWIFAQRLAYNRMSWPELGVSFIYWLPDFGDRVAETLFPLRLYDRLDWGQDSYYAIESREIFTEARARTESRDAMLPYLLRTGVLRTPVKHVMVSAALAWRGAFVSKYWGLAGFLCFVAMTLYGGRRGNHGLLLASLPVWFMVALHALLTVSIPRYNLPLIPIYAVAMAWTAHVAATALVAGRWGWQGIGKAKRDRATHF